MAKGGSWEREISDVLSYWWTRDKDRSVFWRTQGSGARATVRRGKGQRTDGHFGDICGTHPSSFAFTRVVVAEMKKGYKDDNFGDLVDLQTRIKNPPNQRPMEEWIIKNEDACKYSGVPYWVIVHRRTRRNTLIYFSYGLYVRLRRMGCFREGVEPFFRASIKVRRKDKIGFKIVEFCGMRFDDFRYYVCPKDFKILAKRIKREKEKN